MIETEYTTTSKINAIVDMKLKEDESKKILISEESFLLNKSLETLINMLRRKSMKW